MTDTGKITPRNRIINAGKSLGRNILVVFFGILFTVIISLPISLLTGEHITLELFVYLFVMLETSYLIPFLIFFISYDFIQKYLAEKNILFAKLQNQLFVGFACMLISIIMVTIFMITSEIRSFAELPNDFPDYTAFVIFIPVSISINHLISRYYLRRRLGVRDDLKRQLN